MTRVAAVDCGTNSVRLLIADVEGDRLSDVDRQMEIVRLGQGVDRTGRLDPAAIERTMAALRGYAARCEDAGVPPERRRMVATSATRDAENRSDFVDGVHRVLTVEPEVIPGEEEAALSFAGATRELTDAEGEPPYLVVDIGGGSTEFILGGREAQASISTDIGCVRLTERHLAGDPPTAGQVAAVEADVAAALDRVAGAVPAGRARTLVGLAGTVTTIAGIALDLPGYDAERLHHSRLAAADVTAVRDRLLAATQEERAAIPVMHPGRVDVIGAGAIILAAVVDRFGFTDLLVSEHDILDGIAWSVPRR